MKENLGKFFEDLEQNEKTQELLKAECADGAEPDYSALARVARETGFEVTDEEMADFWANIKNNQANASDAMASQIAELSTDEMDQVAGGKDYKICKDTYHQGENCTLQDACNKMFRLYYKKGEEHTCESNTFCEGFMQRTDCTFGRIGL